MHVTAVSEWPVSAANARDGSGGAPVTDTCMYVCVLAERSAGGESRRTARHTQRRDRGGCVASRPFEAAGWRRRPAARLARLSQMCSDRAAVAVEGAHVQASRHWRWARDAPRLAPRPQGRGVEQCAAPIGHGSCATSNRHSKSSSLASRLDDRVSRCSLLLGCHPTAAVPTLRGSRIRAALFPLVGGGLGGRLPALRHSASFDGQRRSQHCGGTAARVVANPEDASRRQKSSFARYRPSVHPSIHPSRGQPSSCTEGSSDVPAGLE